MVIIIALFLSPLLMAADPNKDIGEVYLQQRLEEQELERQRRDAKRQAEEQRKLESIETQKKLDESAGPCFVIDSIEIIGRESISQSTVENIYQPYLSKCLNREAINALLDEINKQYFAKGLITSRAYLPKQNIRTGVLKIQIVEGKVEALNINQNSRLDRMKLWFAMPLQEDDVVNLKDIEQGVDQINRLPSSAATMKLWPGQEVGTSWVNITATPSDEWRGRVAMDNDGAEVTGKARLRFEFEVDNLLHMNDNWGLFLIGSKDTNALSFNYGMPFRYWTFNYAYSYSEYLNFISPVADIFGHSITQNFTVARTLSRQSKGQTKLTASLNRRLSKRQILDVNLAAQRFSSARLAVNQTWRSGFGFWVFDLGYSQGLTAFNAVKDADDAPSFVPKAQFQKVDGSVNVFWSWSQYRFNNSVRLQYSPDNLYSSEQMHLGDRYTVRGYSESPISGDAGFYARNEVSAAMPKFTRGSNSFNQRFNFMRWYSFFDYGGVDRADSEKKVLISGVGAGIKYSEGLAAVDVSLSHSLYSNDANIDGGWQFYLNASVKLY